MICYTKGKEILENLFRRLPFKWPHRKSIVFSRVKSKLIFKILKGIEFMSSIEIFIVFSVRPFDLTVMPGCKGANQLVSDAFGS